MNRRGEMTAVVIGDGPIAVRCGEILRELDVVILKVICGGDPLVSWAREKDIRFDSATPAAFGRLAEEPFDFLFSIFNVHVLPAAVLALPRRAAINYHDALLPRYAGLYAPSWAIFHGEREHGITWHLMTAEVDAGDILRQSRFPISAADTALQVNHRCFEAAVSSFAEMMRDLLQGQMATVPQDLNGRTYFAADARPRAACILDWRKPAVELIALVRALDFGPFQNPLGLPKILLPGGDFVCVSEVQELAVTVDKPPGTILRVDDNSLVVATKAGALTFSGLITSTGLPFSLRQRFDLQVDGVLPALSAREEEEIHEINRSICRHEVFWRRRLETLCEEPLLDRGQGKGDGETPRRATRWALPAEAIELLETKDGWSIAEIIISALGVYLMRRHGEEFFDVGWRVEEDGVKQTCGLFATCVPLRVRPNPEQSLADLLIMCREEIGAVKRRGTFAQDLIGRTPALREAAFLRGGYRPSIVVTRATDEMQEGERGQIVFVLPKVGTEIEVWFDDKAGWAGEIEKTLGKLSTLLGSRASECGGSVGTAEMLSRAERAEVLRMSAGPMVDFRQARAVHSLIEEQARRNPGRIAMECKSEKITYAELNAVANRWASELRREGVQADDAVALMASRSIETLVAMIAILKSGGCYLPIDPANPPERAAQILKDARPKVVLAHPILTDLTAGLGIPTVSLGRENEQEEVNFVVPDLSPPDGRSLAYVIHTSGSSGRPKGVMVEHHSLTNYTQAAIRYFEITAEDRVLQFAALSFDACGEEIYPCLAMGATLVLRTNEMIESGATFLRQCAELAITVLDLPTAYWHHLVEVMAGDNLRLPANVRLVIIGGEAASSKAWERWCAMERRVRVVNTYGPTEGTIVSTWCDLGQGEPGQALAIGRPVPNTEAYVLDARQQLLPIGGVGELYLAGANVARGYLHRPEASEAAFSDSSIFGVEPKRLYRTGDRVRYRPDGNLEFLGRFDSQLKVRGFRIETAEIEAAMVEYSPIRECAVISKMIGEEAGLWAFVVARDNSFHLPDLRAHLRAKLPSYMISARIVVRPALPLLSSGKVDRRALQKWEEAGERTARGRAGSPTENELIQIWREVLGNPNVGLGENFFDVGGHSLAAVAINARVARKFGVEVSLQWLFGEATVEALAGEIATRQFATKPLSRGDASVDAAVTTLFEHILQTSPIRRYADFSERMAENGRSEKLVETIRLQFGVNISRRTLLEKATIAQVAEMIHAAKSKTGFMRWTSLLRRHDSEKIVVLQEATRQPGLFILPGGWSRESELVVFAAMLPDLPRSLSVYGLKHDFAVRSSRVAKSVEAVARNFVREMLAVQPEGAAHLLVECASLTVGLEIAQQWMAAGRGLDRLILLDPTKVPRENFGTNPLYRKLPRKVRRYYEILAGSSLRPYAGKVQVICPEEPASVRDRIRSWGIVRDENLTVTQVPGDHHSYIREHRAEVARLIGQAVGR